MSYRANLEKTCSVCGETKHVQHFPKRGGPYKWAKAHDLKRYDTQCKKCKYPWSIKYADPNYVNPKKPNETAGSTRNRKWKAGQRIKYRRAVKARALSKADRVRHTRIKSWEYMSALGCENCGEKDPRVLEYDHKDPKKKFKAVSVLIAAGQGWGSRRLKTEIRKCRILCANCHRIHTIEQQGHHRHPELQEALDGLLAKAR